MFIRSLATALALATIPFAHANQPLFVVAGSNTIGAKLGPACAQGYLTEEVGAASVAIIPSDIENEFTVVADNGNTIQFEAHGSSTGFKALQNGSADIAMASRPIKATEAAALANLGDFNNVDTEHTVAIDGLAVVVHPNNPVTALTTDQLAAIYSGEINNWADVGGFSAPIAVYARDEKSGTWDTFSALVLKDKPLSTAASRFESNTELSNRVAQLPTAIGFTSLAATGTNTVLAVAGNNTQFLAPDLLTVASEDYLLSRRLYMYTPSSSKNPYVKAFIDYCLSESGQDLVANIGFVPQKIQTVDYRVNDSFPDAYQYLAERAKRLSVNFRFSPSSANLDTKAERDIERLIEFHQQHPDSKLTLVGFSDSTRSASTSKLLSKMRALAVKQQLRIQGVDVSEVLALGDSLIVAGSENAAAKTKNGRVEVWLNSVH